MIEFSVQTPNEPGALATLARNLGSAGVNIVTLAAITIAEEGYIKLVVDNDEQARRVLSDASIDYEEHRIVSAKIHDKPGALADLAEALAANGTNIEAMYLLSSADDSLHFAISVDDSERMRALGD